MALPSSLSAEDLNKFRTRLCERLLQYGECSFGSKCQYSHNLIWKRRSPAKAGYKPQLCPKLLIRENTEILECGDRVCRFAHSLEELLYHPEVYKMWPCTPRRPGGCSLYYCPFSHDSFERSFPSLAATLGIPDFVDVDSMLSEISSFQVSNFRSSPHYPPQIPPLSPSELASADHHPGRWLAVAPGLLVETVARCRRGASEIFRGVFAFRGERRGVVVKTISGCFVSGLGFQQLVAAHEKISDHELSLVRRVVGSGSGDIVFVVMDRCVTSLEHGISDSLLRRLAPVIPRKLADIFSQLAHMHSLGIPHGRLTPANILVDGEGHWRLGDFFGRAAASMADDVLTLGSTLIYAMSGNSREAGREVGLSEISGQFPTLSDLLRRCTLPESEDRPTVHEILDHPIFWTSAQIATFFEVRVARVLADSAGAVVLRSVLSDDLGNFAKFPITKVYDAVRLAETYSQRLQLFFEHYATMDLWASEDERLARIAAALEGREVIGLDRLLDESLLSEFDSSAGVLPATPLSADTPWKYAVLASSSGGAASAVDSRAPWTA